MDSSNDDIGQSSYHTAVSEQPASPRHSSPSATTTANTHYLETNIDEMLQISAIDIASDVSDVRAHNRILPSTDVQRVDVKRTRVDSTHDDTHDDTNDYAIYTSSNGRPCIQIDCLPRHEQMDESLHVNTSFTDVEQSESETSLYIVSHNDTLELSINTSVWNSADEHNDDDDDVIVTPRRSFITNTRRLTPEGCVHIPMIARSYRPPQPITAAADDTHHPHDVTATSSQHEQTASEQSWVLRASAKYSKGRQISDPSLRTRPPVYRDARRASVHVDTLRLAAANDSKRAANKSRRQQVRRLSLYDDQDDDSDASDDSEQARRVAFVSKLYKQMKSERGASAAEQPAADTAPSKPAEPTNIPAPVPAVAEKSVDKEPTATVTAPLVGLNNSDVTVTTLADCDLCIPVSFTKKKVFKQMRKKICYRLMKARAANNNSKDVTFTVLGHL